MMKKPLRLKYLVLLIVCIFIGYISRKTTLLPPDIRNSSLGDAIWAMMVYFGIRWLHPPSRIQKSMLLALSICYGIELSQLYHARWIDNIRETNIGGLVLGFGFLWSDVLAYTLGVALAFRIDEIFLRKRN